jgi:hypothetical protein
MIALRLPRWTECETGILVGSFPLDSPAPPESSIGETSRFYSLTLILANKRRKLVKTPVKNNYTSDSVF